MDNDKKFESVYSSKVRAGKRRTYFFDVRQTKGEDYYITMTESTKRFDGNGYERHKIFLYKEDFNRFLSSLEDTINHVKTELMPDFDYELYERRQQEWEEKLAAEAEEAKNNPVPEESEVTESAEAETTEPAESSEPEAPVETEDKPADEEDISW
ncbi:MAG: DUF3276 family protein [Saprospiraceae bacterium]|nr:PUR family DNA/RNA-binding protein [Bacteroidia bacterium]NNK89370.1 DUF3276 family protein [Saprospiraceae bacterium]